jgi:hypothetical protein
MKKTVRGIFSLMLAFTLVFAMLIPAYAASTVRLKQGDSSQATGLFKGVSDTDFALDRAPTGRSSDHADPGDGQGI